LWTIDLWERYWVVAGWAEDLDFDQRHVQMHQVEERVYGNHTAAAEERARQIDHIHHVEVEERVKQIEQSFGFATEEPEKRIYRTPVLVVRAMLIVHKIAAGVVERKAVVGGIRPAKAHNPFAVAEVAADLGKTGASGKKVEVAVVGIADSAGVAEVEAVR
jgi:hypothetical protein